MQIVDFEPRHAKAWKELNEAWISKWFALEAKDHEVLSDPVTHILEKGGHILLAETADEVQACAALLDMGDGGFELAKMTVVETARGQGLGHTLMQACIARARSLGARRLYLETNSALAPALGLYVASGFVFLPPQASGYSRGDTWMELELGKPTLP